MILAIDIGNSSIKVGLFNNNKPAFTKTFQVNSKKFHIISFLNPVKSKITFAGISSVVPKVNRHWTKIIKDEFNIKPLFISGSLRLPIKIKAKKPPSLGADRICNAVAGYEFFKRRENVIVIDFGTATTYDIVLKR